MKTAGKNDKNLKAAAQQTKNLPAKKIPQGKNQVIMKEDISKNEKNEKKYDFSKDLSVQVFFSF